MIHAFIGYRVKCHYCPEEITIIDSWEHTRKQLIDNGWKLNKWWTKQGKVICPKCAKPTQ